MDRFIQEVFEPALDAALPPAAERPAALHAAMRWAVQGGGKRVRPRICFGAARAVGGRAEDALMCAVAVELLHSYTLVHDDLPCMDNDTERRGRPSVWAKFGEAHAVLAGDALQALAFACAARAPRAAAACAAELAARGVGVVRGQTEDIAPGAAPDIDYIHERKCADLFCAAAVTGARAAGGGDAEAARVRAYARHLGLAFQFQDDLLDGDTRAGRAETARRVRAETEAALAALAGLPGDTAPLAELARRLADRTR